MATPVIMPRQGQSVETCILVSWHISEGDKVEEGDILLSYETDKAAFELEAPAAGILLTKFYDEGDEVPILENVAVIGEKGEDISEFSLAAPVAEKAPPAIETLQTVSEPEKIVSDSAAQKISPRAKKMAQLHNISFASIAGSGPAGRVIVRDIEAVIAKAPVAATAPPAAKAPVAAQTQMTRQPVFSGEDRFEIRKISNIRKIIAEKMQISLQNSAQLTHHTSADARKILSLRKQFKADFEAGRGPNITINDMVCLAVVRTLGEKPQINAHWLGDSIKTFSSVHLGIAVDTERGLMVPAIRNAENLSLTGLTVAIKQVAGQCRQGSIDPELLDSAAASFTVSNLGAYGVEIFTPVLNLPQVGILGVNTISYQAREIADQTVGFVPVIGLSLTYDHRAIDGAPASDFLKQLRKNIEEFQTV